VRGPNREGVPKDTLPQSLIQRAIVQDRPLAVAPAQKAARVLSEIRRLNVVLNRMLLAWFWAGLVLILGTGYNRGNVPPYVFILGPLTFEASAAMGNLACVCYTSRAAGRFAKMTQAWILRGLQKLIARVCGSTPRLADT
jgi:hypothetical protein